MSMQSSHLTIDQFKTMDQLAITQYGIPVELMMENAGLQLASFITKRTSKDSKILIGAGTGNNGGGGLVAARRLSGWGYQVHLDIPDPNLKDLPASQLNRAIAFGANRTPVEQPQVFVDAYFGFSQRQPIPAVFQESLLRYGLSGVYKISLDIPTGFDKETGEYYFTPDSILTMAAPKTELILSGISAEIFVVDIGIPVQLYHELGAVQPDFAGLGFVKQDG